MLYTGYYAKLKQYEEKGLVPVAISRGVPRNYNGIIYNKFAPSWSLVRQYKEGLISNTSYEKAYIEYLNTLDKEDIRYDFESPHCVGNLIFLCYEKPYEFCHRHILGKWLKENFNFDVDEYRI